MNSRFGHRRWVTPRGVEPLLGTARGESHHKPREAAGPRVLRCRLSARCAELSWKETLPNPSAEPFPTPAGAAGRARGSLGSCHPPAPSRSWNLIPKKTGDTPQLSQGGFRDAQPGRVRLLSPKILPAAHGSSAPAPSRSAASLLPALLGFPRLK